MKHLNNSCDVFRERRATVATVSREHVRRAVENSIGIITVLNPYIGYANATRVAQEAHAAGRSVCGRVLEKGRLSRQKLDEILRPEALTRPSYIPSK